MLALPSVVAFELGLPHKLIGGAVDEAGKPLYRVRVARSTAVRCARRRATRCSRSTTRRSCARPTPWWCRASNAGRRWNAAGLEDADACAALDGRGARLMSICTGAFVLAAAGRLDGRPATTHWMHTARFQQFFPAVRLDPDVLFVDDGDVLTSAGNAAGIDLCLHLVRRDHGLAVANRVARRSVVSPWREGGQSQFVEPLADVAGEDTAATRAWALDRLDQPLTLADLAAHAAMSVRTFTRRFRDETGVSPVRWLTDRRVEVARRLLETTELPVDRVAQRAGFGTPTALRQQLHAAIGVAPLAYRRTYRPAAQVASWRS